MRLRFFLALLLVPLPAVAGTILVQPALDLQAIGDTSVAVDARPGDEIRVELPAQPGTGYSWEAETSGAALGTPVEVPGLVTGAVPGGIGMQVFILRAREEGASSVIFRYRRPWLPESESAGRLEVSVRIGQ